MIGDVVYKNSRFLWDFPVVDDTPLPQSENESRPFPRFARWCEQQVARPGASIVALIFIGLWFVVQFLSGVGSLGATGSAASGGVAWWAHIGGFAVGAILAGTMKSRTADIYGRA